MHTVRRILGTAIAPLLVVGPAVACGSDDDVDLTATVPATTAPATAAPPSTAPASTAVAATPLLRGELVVGELRGGAPPGGVVVGPGAYAIVEVWRAPYMEADTSAELIASVRVDDIDGFPVAFEFPEPVPFEARQPGVEPEFEYLPRATVRLGDGGVLFKDYRLTIDGSTESLVIELTAFEPCDQPDSGGPCAAGESTG